MSASRAADKAQYTVREAAAALGISENLVRDLIHSGQLTAYRYSPRKTVIYSEDLEAFKVSRRINSSKTKEVG